MKKLALGLTLITAGIPCLLVVPCYCDSPQANLEPLQKEADDDKIPFSFQLTKDADLATIIEAMFTEAEINDTLNIYPRELTECIQKIRAGKKRVAARILKPLMPYILNYLIPDLVKSGVSKDIDIAQLITRGQRPFIKQSPTINSDVTHPVFPSVDLDPILRLLCEVLKKLDRLGKAGFAIDPAFSFTQCCQDLSDAINALDEKLSSDWRNLRDHLQEITAKFEDQEITTSDISNLKDTFHEAHLDTLDSYENLAHSIDTVANQVNIAEDNILNDLADVKFTLTECYQRLCDTLEGVEYRVDMLSSQLNEGYEDTQDPLNWNADDQPRPITRKTANRPSKSNNYTTFITQLPYVITEPGIYVVTTNVYHNIGNAITIASDDVVLDLGSHTIKSVSINSPDNDVIRSITNGITANGFSNITIQNGSIADMNGCGVSLEDCSHITLTNINVLNNIIGIEIRGNTELIDPLSSCEKPSSQSIKIRECRAYKNQCTGILISGVKDVEMTKTALIENGTTSDHIKRGGVVLEFSADILMNKVLSSSNAVGYLFSLVHNADVNNCVAMLNQEDGIRVQGEDIDSMLAPSRQILLIRCKAVNNRGTGINLMCSQSNSIHECECKSNGQEGINLAQDTDFNSIRANTLSSNSSYGIYDHRAPFKIDLVNLGITDLTLQEVLNMLELDSDTPTTNRIFGNYGNNNHGSTTTSDLLTFQLGSNPVTIELGDKNFRNVPALVNFLQGCGTLGTTRTPMIADTANALSNISS